MNYSWQDTRRAARRLADRVKRGIVEREYRPIYHAAAITAIVIIALLLFYKSFTMKGTLIHADMTFPLTIERNFSLFTNSWLQYISAQNVFSLQRLFWVYPFLLVAKVLGLSVAQFLFILFVSTFIIAGVAMYALAYSVISKFTLNGAVWLPFIGSVVAAVIFMYNPWSLNHFWSYFLYPAYALFPFVFLLTMKTFDSPSVGKVIGLCLLLTIASTTPHGVIWLWLLITSYAVYHLLLKKFAWKSVVTAVKVFAGSLALYLLMNAYWVIPYSKALIAGKTLVPYYMQIQSVQMQKSVLDLLSNANNIQNNLRLTAGFGMIWPIQPFSSNTMWVILSFTLPVLAIMSFMLFRKRLAGNRVVNYWVVMATAMILLATGSSFILGKAYRYFVVSAPGSYSLGWIFRASDRWLIFVPVFYALMIGLLVTRLLGNGRNGRSLGEETNGGG